MRRPALLWFGLAPAIGLWLALILVETPRLEGDLVTRADALVRPRLGETVHAVAEGRDLRVEGLVFDETARAPALAALGALRGAGRVADRLSAPPKLSPYEWRASRDGENLTLGGAAPSPADRAALIAAARAAAPGVEVRDEMTYATGARSDFLVQTKALLAALGHLRSGVAQSRDGAATLAGEAANDEDYQAALMAAPLPVTLDLPPPLPARAAPADQAPPRPGAEDCRSRLAEAARAAYLGFAPGVARLTPASNESLKALAGTAKACPDAVLQISGFVDEAGHNARDPVRSARDLAWRRAETVAAVLLAEGVAPQRLHISGESDVRRASSRAVEIMVK